MKEQNVFHVGIPEAEEVRRSLLEAARATISCLQRYEKFGNVREEKQKAIEEFASIVQEIHALDEKLNKILPRFGMGSKPSRTRKVSKRSEPKKRDMPKPKQSELEALEKDLVKIDSALSKLK